MYQTTGDKSSRQSFNRVEKNDAPYSFFDNSQPYGNGNQIKRFSEQIYSFPINYHLHKHLQAPEQNNFNSGWTSQLSKIEEINNQIARTTQQILSHKTKYKTSQSYNHQVLNQPEVSKLKYKRQYVRYDSPRSSLTKYNCGLEPTLGNVEQKAESSKQKRSQQSNVKVNFLYQNQGQKDSINARQTIKAQRPKQQKPEQDLVKSPKSSLSPQLYNHYSSTDLILVHGRDLMRKKSQKKVVKFNYQNSPENPGEQKQNQNIKSSISAYQLAKYPSNQHLRRVDSNNNEFGKADSENKLKYLPQDYRPRQLTQTNSPVRKDVFYDMNEPRIQDKMRKQSKKKEQKQRKLFDQQKAYPNKEVDLTTIGILISQVKDKQSKLISIVLIALAIMIFIMQLFS